MVFNSKKSLNMLLTIDGCHCERSETISVLLAIEIATAFGLAMTSY
jgi:hypothetical protein